MGRLCPVLVCVHLQLKSQATTPAAVCVDNWMWAQIPDTRACKTQQTDKWQQTWNDRSACPSYLKLWGLCRYPKHTHYHLNTHLHAIKESTSWRQKEREEDKGRMKDSHRENIETNYKNMEGDEEKPSGEKWASESETEWKEREVDRDRERHQSIMRRCFCQTRVIDEER